jgi:hypothetical protein
MDVSVVFDSSTVITPSPPTFSIASATSSPMVESLWAEIVATWAFSLRLRTSRDIGRSAAIAAFAARTSPRFRSIALADVDQPGVAGSSLNRYRHIGRIDLNQCPSLRE